MEAQNDLPWKRRVWTFFYTFTPWFPSKRRAASVFITIGRCSTVRCGGCGGCTLLYRPIEINTDAVAGFARVFVGQSEDKGRSVTYAGSNFTCSNVDWTLRLAKIHHIQGHTEVFMVFYGITTQQCGNLKRSGKKNRINITNILCVCIWAVYENSKRVWKWLNYIICAERAPRNIDLLWLCSTLCWITICHRYMDMKHIYNKFCFFELYTLKNTWPAFACDSIIIFKKETLYWQFKMLHCEEGALNWALRGWRWRVADF